VLGFLTNSRIPSPGGLFGFFPVTEEDSASLWIVNSSFVNLSCDPVYYSVWITSSSPNQISDLYLEDNSFKNTTFGTFLYNQDTNLTMTSCIFEDINVFDFISVVGGASTISNITISKLNVSTH
jgi:hypothetical protein